MASPILRTETIEKVIDRDQSSGAPLPFLRVMKIAQSETVNYVHRMRKESERKGLERGGERLVEINEQLRLLKFVTLEGRQAYEEVGRG